MTSHLKPIYITVYCLAMTMSVVLGVSPTQAQTTLPIIYSNLFPILNASWTHDGTEFNFQMASYCDGTPCVGVITPTFESWFIYDATQKTVSLKGSTTWGQYESLASRLPSQIMPAVEPEGAISFIFPSPDGRYLVYATPRQKGEPSGYPLAIVDTLSGKTNILTEVRAIDLAHFTTYYNVIWSPDSTVFVVQRNTGFAADLTTYVNVSTADSLQLIDITEIPLNGKLYLTERKFFALSTDGKKAVLPIYGGIDDFGVLIWNLEDVDNNQFIAAGQDVVSAMFTDDDQAVLYIGDNGLMKYDLSTGETLLVDASINATWVDKAWFSPTGKQIALLESDAPLSDLNTLYMYEIPPLK